MKSEILENDDVTCAGKSHNRTIVISWFGIIIGSLNMHNDLFLSDVRQPEMDVLQSLAVILIKLFCRLSPSE